jgi:hypothetical protein
MKTLESIKKFPCHFRITTTDEEILVLDYDGQQGVFTRKQWLDDEVLCQFDKQSQEAILNELENTCNGNFFYQP